jgi:selenocysteine-specific elongation factor
VTHAILGTAGHIDHGKTALVRALTGVDTDRLPEERARGITIELGFAELAREGRQALGVVDVPGHEDFVRTMVAGATGMDVVLLVVAADEGVMPQTREHLDIVGLLHVPELVVALTKCDLVDEDWLELVTDDVRTLLASTPYAHASIVRTSATSRLGIDALLAELDTATRRLRRRATRDLARLPVDRVFTVQGTGTVVTGTLWSGSVTAGERVRLLPGGGETRVRAVQVHGREVERAEAGARTALALAGLERAGVDRGLTVVSAPGWRETWMLTVRARVLPGAPRALEHNQRVRVHLGTAEVLARCALLQGHPVEAGGTGWIQLRLEEPVVARARDHVVLRAYSPLATLGGGEVAEPSPVKRRALRAGELEALTSILDAPCTEAVAALLELASWEGVAYDELPVRTGATPGSGDDAVRALLAEGVLEAGGRVFAAAVAAEAERRMLEALEVGHRAEPLRSVVPLARLRGTLPAWAPPALAEAALGRIARTGALELVEGGARTPGFRPTLAPAEEDACARLAGLYAEAGLAPPAVGDLPPDLRGRPDLPELLRYLEARGTLRTLAEELFIDARTLTEAARAVALQLGGRTGLGPADFRAVLPVSRRHLIPLLLHLDGLGVTLRRGDVRDVAPPAPDVPRS